MYYGEQSLKDSIKSKALAQRKRRLSIVCEGFASFCD